MEAAAALAAVLFVSTDLDDLLVLVVLFADPRLRRSHVVVGQYTGICVLFAVGLGLSLTAQVIPRDYLGLLGLAPIAIGAKKLVDSGDDERVLAARNGVFTVAATTIANGGDNIGVYTPVFAVHGGADIAIFGLVFALLTGLWLALAHWLVSHRAFSAAIRRHGHWAVPVALILIGASILYQADSFGLISRAIDHATKAP